MAEQTVPLPPEGSLTADDLRALPEGALVVTYGVGWAKIGPDEWRCPYRLSDDRRNSEWLAPVARFVAFNPADYAEFR